MTGPKFTTGVRKAHGQTGRSETEEPTRSTLPRPGLHCVGCSTPPANAYVSDSTVFVLVSHRTMLERSRRERCCSLNGHLDSCEHLFIWSFVVSRLPLPMVICILSKGVVKTQTSGVPRSFYISRLP
ncbi:hypothetical protein QR685DRAFT_26177 [Neurospora intermedia]|uniref:Uncharacterized protein n=1 Tax=Neurospora intermedia TaxID=5142 RepID=A0ABR3DSQ4_NEUIN